MSLLLTLIYFTPFSSVFVAAFEQVIVCCARVMTNFKHKEFDQKSEN